MNPPRLPALRSAAAAAFAEYAAEAWCRACGAQAADDARRFGLLAGQLWEAGRDGQVCLPLSLLPAESRALLERWCNALGPLAPESPLVREHGHAWLRRHAVLEQRVAERLRVFDAAAPLGAVPPADGLDATQAHALALALSRRLLVLTGGPGTGKTHTVARILEALRHALPGARMAAAAPTGKAASRLAEQLAARGLDVPARTVDSLLGRGAGRRARFDAREPLPLEVLVIDECSMLGLGSFARLLEALPDEARLVLVGDHAQLASVDAGAVFAQLVEDTVLPDAVVNLVRNHRAGAAPHAAFALAIRAGQGAEALALLAASGDPALSTLPPPADAQRLLERWDGWRPLAAAVLGDDDEALLAAAHDFRILCAQREGPLGTQAVNAALAARIGGGRRMARGRVLLVTRNDRALGLSNGDTGVCLDARRVAFLRAGTARVLPVSALPAHEDGAAVTVHKSQGSEWRRVLLVAAHLDSPLATRELLYTGATRARESLAVCGAPEAVAQAVSRPTRRHGALAARLAALR